MAGKQSVLCYRSGRKHQLLRKNSHSWILVIRLVLPPLQWDTGTVTPRKTERQQSVITQRAFILMAWVWRKNQMCLSIFKTIFRFEHIAKDLFKSCKCLLFHLIKHCKCLRCFFFFFFFCISSKYFLNSFYCGYRNLVFMLQLSEYELNAYKLIINTRRERVYSDNT